MHNKTKFCSNTKNTEPFLYKKVLKSSLWLFSLKIIENLLNLIKLIVLARLLSPNDFGLFGIALILLITLETFSQTGFSLSLIQRRDDVREYFDTVWTIGILRGFLIAIIIFFISPSIAYYFDIVDNILMLRIIGLSVVIKSFCNISVILWQKELNFKKYFTYNLFSTLISFIITITIALIYYNVWALVIGLLAGNIAALIMSYILSPYRPKIELDFVKAKRLWSFGKWIFATTVLSFLIIQGSSIFIAKFLGITMLGFYKLAQRTSDMAIEMSNLIINITFPAYSKIQDDIIRLRKAYLKVLKVTTFLSFFLMGIIFLLAEDFTLVFLGAKWIFMIPTMKVLALTGIIRSINFINIPIFQALGKPVKIVRVQIIRLLLIIILIYPLTLYWGIFGTALTIFISVFISSTILTINTVKFIECKKIKFVKVIIYPLINLIIMSLVVLLAKHFILEISLFHFVLFVGLGGLVYLFVAYLFDKYVNYNMISLAKEGTKLFR